MSAIHPEPLEDQLVLESLLSRGNPNYKPAFPLVVISLQNYLIGVGEKEKSMKANGHWMA